MPMLIGHRSLPSLWSIAQIVQTQLLRKRLLVERGGLREVTFFGLPLFVSLDQHCGVEAEQGKLLGRDAGAAFEFAV